MRIRIFASVLLQRVIMPSEKRKLSARLDYDDDDKENNNNKLNPISGRVSAGARSKKNQKQPLVDRTNTMMIMTSEESVKKESSTAVSPYFMPSTRWTLDADEDSLSKKSKWQPPNWLEQFKRIREMRSSLSAPVDTMGCDSLSNLDPTLPPKVKRFHTLVALMLSAQTKDEVTARAALELTKLPLDVQTILNTEEEVIAKAIYPVSFYKRKAQYIKKTAQILKDKYDEDIPDSVEDLCQLPGVGPKMAYLTMASAWKRNVGIGVDTHVHRISNRLGWTRMEAKTPEHTRKELEDWLPQEYWQEVNHLLVGFGQQTCRPVGPKCGECKCKDICPTGKLQQSRNKAKSKKRESESATE